ncbi:MAG: COG1361 family protein [Planctomycetota bacterium]|jgi:hypothetical protein
METIDEPYVGIKAVTAVEEPGGQVEWSESWAGYTPEQMAKMQVTETAFPTGRKETSAILLRRVMPVEVLLEGEYTYEYHVTNLTDLTHQNVKITIEDTQNLNVLSSSPALMKDIDGSLRWAIGDLAPRETKVIRVQAESEVVGAASDCVSVTYANALCGQTKVVDPELLLIKTAKSDGYICDDFWFTYEVVNPGSGTAKNVRIRDEIPSGLRTVDGNKAIIEIAGGDLAPGERKKFTVKAKGVETGKHRSIAVATADGGLISKSENIETLIYQPVLMIVADSPARQYMGRNVDLTYTVKNLGDAVAKNTVVTAVIQGDGANVVQTSDRGTVGEGKITWQLGSLGVDQSKTVSVKLNGTKVGQVISNVSAVAECAAEVQDSTASAFLGVPAILLELVDNGDPAEVGDTVTYTVTVYNQGSAADTNIAIVCQIPIEQEYLGTEGPTRGILRGRTLTFAPLPRLDVRATSQWKIKVRTKKAGDVRFGVFMTTDQLTDKVLETEATNIY